MKNRYQIGQVVFHVAHNKKHITESSIVAICHVMEEENPCSYLLSADASEGLFRREGLLFATLDEAKAACR